MRIIRYILRRIMYATNSFAAFWHGSQASSLKAYDTTGRKLSKPVNEMSVEEIAVEWVKFCEERKRNDTRCVPPQ